MPRCEGASSARETNAKEFVAYAKWHEFGVGGHAKLCVPDSDMDPNLIAYNSESKSLKLRQGWTPGFGFLFDAARVKADISSFHVAQEFGGHPYANALSGSVGFLDLADRTRYGASMRARNIDEIWHATGSCNKSEITPIGSGIYRAMCSARDDYASIWNRAPDSLGKMPSPDDFVLATCRYESIDVGKYAGSVMRTCSRVIVIGEFIFDYRFQESNLGLIPAMDALLAKRLTEWKKNCSANR